MTLDKSQDDLRPGFSTADMGWTPSLPGAITAALVTVLLGCGKRGPLNSIMF